MVIEIGAGAFLRRLRVQLASCSFDQRVDLDVHRDVEVRDCRFRLGQPARDDFAHRAVRHQLVRRGDRLQALATGAAAVRQPAPARASRAGARALLRLPRCPP